MKKLLPIIALFLFYCLGLALGPRVPDEQQRQFCVKNIYLPGPFGISLNCDSPVYLEDATNPRLLLAENAVYQGRPLHITLVGGIGYPLRLVTTPILHALNLDERMGFGLDIIDKDNPYRATKFDSEADVAAGITMFVPYFIAYFLFDVLLLVGAYFLYIRLVLPEVSLPEAPLAVLLVGLLLAVNDLTKAFLLSPHSQIFNLFVPLFSLFVFMQLATAPDRRRVLLIGILTGLGMLAYAYFAITVPVGIVALLVYWKGRGGWRTTLTRATPDALLLIGIAALPMVVWVGYVIHRNGAFYSFEVDCCQQIVWMGTAWAAGGFGGLVRQLTNNIFYFGQQFVRMSGIPLLLALLVGVFGWRGRRGWKINDYNRLLLSGAILVSVVSVLFFSLLGYKVSRLATGSVVPLLVGLGLLVREAYFGMDNRQQRLLNGGFLVVMISIVIFVLLKSGPYS